MIKITRCKEPAALEPVRLTELARLRHIKDPTSDDVGSKYQVVAADLWNMQFQKCCYCEAYIPKAYNDVEHLRPKAKAVRTPGCNSEHGYWWLAFTWKNLLYSCPGCNRSAKNAKFPLATADCLNAEDTALGVEKPLFIDPAGAKNPVLHIKYERRKKFATSPERWFATERNNSQFGVSTIDVCDLNRDELLETRERAYETIILPQVKALRDAIRENDLKQIIRQFARAEQMQSRRNLYAALTYDVFCENFSNVELQGLISRQWSAPANACKA
jgi:uncharacterized protein (TIGR02646 family)